MAPAMAAPGARAAWSRPIDLMAPGTLDVTAPVLTIGPGSTLTAAFGLQDVDTPGSAVAQVAQRAAGGVVSPLRGLTGVALPLAAGQLGAAPLVLGGTAAPGQPCCTAVEAVRIGAGGVTTTQRLLSGLDGETLGTLVALGSGHALAAWATTAGVWAAVAGHGTRFGGARRLAGPARSPETLAAAGLGGGASVIAWDSVAGASTTSDPRTITVARGGRDAPPFTGRTAVTVAAGHRVGEVAVAGGAGRATLTWIDAWSDAAGEHEQVRAQDLVPGAHARSLGAATTTAAGLQVAGDPAGDGAVSWSACGADGSCQVMLAARRAGRPFGPVRAVGAIDPGQLPALALGGHGEMVLAWSRGGSPWALSGPAGGRLGAARRLSPTTYAYDLTAAVGAAGQGAVAWSQATLHPSVVAAVSGL